MTDSSSGVVTIWTAAYFDTGKGKHRSTEITETGYYFVSEQLDTFFQLSERLAKWDNSTNNLGLPFITIARVEGETPWLSKELCSAFPGYSADIIRDIVDPKRRQRGTVVLPKMDKKRSTLSFSMQYPYTHSDDSKRHATEPKINKFTFAPIATWISTATDPPTILLVCRDEQIPERLQSHLVSCNWRYSLLARDPARIFVDLLVLLADWADVLMIAQHDFAQRNIQVHTNELPLLRKTKELHRDAEGIIALREDLRLHIAAVRKFSFMMNAHRPMMKKLRFLCRRSIYPVCDSADEDLDEQTEECLQNLLHQQESAAVIHKQLQNLLSLAFNTEMVSQGQAVARLNFLAFIFLPLSFVATVFGMTKFTISAVWYPLWAFAVIVLVFLCFFAANHLPDNLLRTLSNERRVTSLAKNNKEINDTLLPGSSTTKASKLAWLKPNYYWWLAVPVIGWWIFVRLLKRRRAAKPDLRCEAERGLQVEYDPTCTKVSTPMPHSYLRGAGIQQPNYLFAELQSINKSQSQELWPISSPGGDGPQIESSNVRRPGTPTIVSSKGRRV